MADIVSDCIRCHELLTNPQDVDVADLIALHAAYPETFHGTPDIYAVTHCLFGWSRAETRRRGATMSEQFSTPRPTLKWASLKYGRNDYEPILIDHEPR